GRVDGCYAKGFQRLGVLRRDDAADDDGNVIEPFLAHALHDVLHEGHVRAREDRQADDVDALIDGCTYDLAGRQANAFIDDLHAGIASADGDLLGAIGMTIEAGLTDEELDTPAEAVGHFVDAGAYGLQLCAVAGDGRLCDAGRRAVFAEDFAQRRAPFAG